MRTTQLGILLLLITASALAQGANTRLIRDALVALNVSPNSEIIDDAVHQAFSELLPGESFRRYRLNRTQAQAIAYIATTIAASSVSSRPPAHHESCASAITATYDLAAAIPPDGPQAGLFVSTDEKEIVRAGAQEIRSLAVACGCYTLADAALVLPTLVDESLPDRDEVVATLDELRRIATACD